MVRDFQRVIGDEARAQVLELTGRLPDAVVACVGGGSNAMGIFTAFLDDAEVALHGFEAGGEGVASGRHAATLSQRLAGRAARHADVRPAGRGWPDVPSHSVSAGLDYPGVGPEHAWLHDTGRATYAPVTDDEAMDAFALLCRTEGIIPAIESAHALAGALTVGRALGPDGIVLVNLSGRGDKDVDTAAAWFGVVSGEEIVESAAAGSRTRRRPATAGERASMTRLDDVLAATRAEGRAALVGYLPAGYPSRRRRRPTRWRPWCAAASTSSRSGCPTPTR